MTGLRQHFVYILPGTENDRVVRQYDGYIRISVTFDETVPVEVTAKPHIAAQRNYIEESIKRMILTTVYKQGLLGAVYSAGRQGENMPIGNPPALSALAESYAELSFGGNIHPAIGVLGPATYLQVERLLIAVGDADDCRSEGGFLRILSTEGNGIQCDLDCDASVPEGMVRWFYDQGLI